MCIVGDDDVNREYVILIGEIFYMEVYSNLGKKTDSLDHLCKLIYTKPKYISIFACLPLVGRFNSICYLYAHLEVNICKNLEQSLEEEDYGFERNTDGQLIQIITDKSPARTYFLQGMKCRCEKPKLNRYILDAVAL